jgi:hypothetical protein
MLLRQGGLLVGQVGGLKGKSTAYDSDNIQQIPRIRILLVYKHCY